MANQYLQSSDNKKRSQALLGAIIFHALLLLLFFLVIFHTPIPPFPETGGSPGIEINFGTSSQGMGNVEANDMGNIQAEKEDKQPKIKQEESSSKDDNIAKSDVEESISLAEKRKKDKKQKVTRPIEKIEEKKIEEKKPSNELANALGNLKNHKQSQNGGDGNSGKAGNEGDPNGSPTGDGGGGGGNGTGMGSGNGPSYSLSGRKMLKVPQLLDDSQDEGRVVVEITVDATGKVIQASPGARGSTTTSSVLYAKARQAALKAQFNAAAETTEQKGTITFVFILH